MDFQFFDLSNSFEMNRQPHDHEFISIADIKTESKKKISIKHDQAIGQIP